MSKAITFAEFGGPEVLEFKETDAPVAGPGQILIRVRTAAVNPLDGKIRRGEMESSFPTSLPAIPGYDVAGEVEALGEGVEGIAVGDAVLGSAIGGSYREQAVMERFTAKPAGVPWDVAAALPMAADTAARALRLLDLSSGQTLLILGAVGSVGAVATQLAVAQGIKVIGAVAEADAEALLKLGGTPVKYGEGLAERVRSITSEKLDGVLDTAGRGPIAEALELVDGPGRILTLADFAAVEQYGIRATTGGPGEQVAEALDDAAELVASGDLVIGVGRTYPMAEAWRAHEDMEAGGISGKLILETG